MLWVYEHHKYVYSYSAGIDFSESDVYILTTKVAPRAVRVKAKRYRVNWSTPGVFWARPFQRGVSTEETEGVSRGAGVKKCRIY